MLNHREILQKLSTGSSEQELVQNCNIKLISLIAILGKVQTVVKVNLEKQLCLWEAVVDWIPSVVEVLRTYYLTVLIKDCLWFFCFYFWKGFLRRNYRKSEGLVVDQRDIEALWLVNHQFWEFYSYDSFFVYWSNSASDILVFWILWSPCSIKLLNPKNFILLTPCFFFCNIQILHIKWCFVESKPAWNIEYLEIKSCILYQVCTSDLICNIGILMQIHLIVLIY